MNTDGVVYGVVEVGAHILTIWEVLELGLEYYPGPIQVKWFELPLMSRISLFVIACETWRSAEVGLG